MVRFSGVGLAAVVLASCAEPTTDLDDGTPAQLGDASVARTIPTTPQWTSTASAGYGRNVRVADIQSDGFLDIVVSAQDSAEVAILAGTATGIGTTPTSTLTGNLGSTFGASLELGDINGDGFPDLAVGSPGDGLGTGSISVYLGAAGGYTTATTATDGLLGGLGYDLAVADVNGDGFDDVIGGEPYDGLGNGAIAQFLGSAGGIATTASMTATGTANFGAVVADGGDVNTDGFDDVIACTQGQFCRVYYGSATGLSSGSYTQVSEGTDAGFGRNAFGGFDFDGDGFDDVFVGSRTYNAGDGRMYLYRGSAGGTDATLPTVFDSPLVGGQFGSFFLPIADLDGDGIGDYAAGGANDVYLYGGTATGMTAAPILTIHGNSSGGFAPGPTVDLNADGLDDLLASNWVDGVVVGYLAYADDDNDGVIVGGDGTDQDCDDNDASVGSATAWYADVDGDGHGAGIAILACTPPSGAVASSDDCDDAEPDAFPGNTEVCDGIDNDCDGDADAGTLDTFYADADADGYGDSGTATDACVAPSGYVDLPGDCDDGNATVNPAALEACDGVDNDCDAVIDEDVVDQDYYLDADADGFGDADSSPITACQPPSADYVADGTDCDDADADINPAALEVCDGIDQDCDGTVDDGLGTAFFADTDADGFGDATASQTACSAPSGYVADGTDCDDTDATVNPSAPEICDLQDNDCDVLIDEEGLTTYFADTDDDGFGDAADTQTGCGTAPDGYVLDDTDCDDTAAAVNPDATEVCNAVDDDCDGDVDEDVQVAFYADADDDGFGDPADTELGCEAPEGYVADDTDCDDAAATVNPDATEVCNAIDDNCDGQIDEGVTETQYTDADGDGFGDVASPVTGCELGEGVVADATDCDDADATVFPGAAEVEGDGIDQNCDGVDPFSPLIRGGQGCSTVGGSGSAGIGALLIAGMAMIRRKRG